MCLLGALETNHSSKDQMTAIMGDPAKFMEFISNDKFEGLLPSKILQDVRLKLEDIKLRIPELSTNPDFKSKDFAYEVNKLKKLATEIAQLKEKFM